MRIHGVSFDGLLPLSLPAVELEVAASVAGAQDVDPGTAEQGVGAAEPGDEVVSALAADHVVARLADDLIRPAVARQDVVPG